jgi:hypothetical protein
MTDQSAIAPESEGVTLDDLENEWQAEQKTAEDLASAPDAAEKAEAEALAARINAGFLWMVNRTQCPHIEIENVVDRAKGDEAFLPLAEKWGGEVPEWLMALQPYIGAGVYMGTTIITARQIERQIIEEAERQKAAAAEGADSGQKSAD